MKIARFVVAWLATTGLLGVLFAIVLPANENGEVVLSGFPAAIVLVVPIVCGICAARSTQDEGRDSVHSDGVGRGHAVKIPLSKRKREDMAADLLTQAEVSASLASDTVYVSTFLEEWDSMMQALETLTAFEGKVRFKNGTPSSDIAKLNSEFQWKLRDAIERAKDHTVSEITGKYRNSKEHKERRCSWFCSDIEEVWDRFSDETKNFANSATREVFVAAGSSLHKPFVTQTGTTFAAYGGIDAELSDVDLMEGHAFEHWCAELLRKIGFTSVEVTRGSGDQGVDVLAQKDGIKYAIQCKCYSSDLGNKPVQEVHAGQNIYHCQIGAVMTNRYFTPGAKELAEATGVLLWDRDWIKEKLESISDGKSFDGLLDDDNG